MSDPALGQVLALLSALAFAFANNFIQRTSKSGGDKGVMFSVLVTMGLSALLWLALEADGDAARFDWTAVGWFLAAGVLAMVFGRSLVFKSIRMLGVSRATAVKRLNPFFSVLLAAVFLAEPITGIDGLGMLVIMAGFGVLIRESFQNAETPTPPALAYMYGVAGALAYAVAYIGRKLGLETMHAPALGTLISAMAGFATFALLAVVWERHRTNFRNMFAHLDVWIICGAVCVSLGQILMFAALAYEKVSVVVLIASLEIFLSIFLSVGIFRSERMPGPSILLAAALAMAGVALVTIG